MLGVYIGVPLFGKLPYMYIHKGFRVVLKVPVKSIADTLP